jgi:hypothetical protein
MFIDEMALATIHRLSGKRSREWVTGGLCSIHHWIAYSKNGIRVPLRVDGKKLGEASFQKQSFTDRDWRWVGVFR